MADSTFDWACTQYECLQRPGQRRGVLRCPGVTVDLDSPTALLPAFMIARKVQVSKQLVSTWVKSEKLKPAGEGADGRPLYRLMDAWQLEAAMRNNPRSSRRRKPTALAVA